MAFYDVWSLTQPLCAQMIQWFDGGPRLEAWAIISAFVTLLLLEIRLSHGAGTTRAIRQSYRTNLATFLFNDLLMSLLSVSSLLVLAERWSGHGLLRDIDDSAVRAVITFILLDLVLYLWHRANHRFDWLWMFHRVHHSDRSMNVSTAFRLHAGELLLTTVVKAAFIVATGIEAVVVATCEAVTTVFVLFHHANVAFRAEQWLARLIVVPSLHRVHHSVLRSEHDSNYGAVFSIWDKLFRTYTQPKPVEVGLPRIDRQNFLELLRYGFPRPVPALSTPEATPGPTPGWPSVPTADVLSMMIAEAAYYRAERRGFAPGGEFADWVGAERDIRRQFDATGECCTTG